MKNFQFEKYYYLLKKIIPRTTQISIRRKMIQRKVSQYSAVWPIDEKAAKPPENWKGWPDGKKFAFIITHDVETARGVENCRSLMDIEEKYGFRSSFNFVAGDYTIPQNLLAEMHRLGFEVGSHGLHHNGNLFRSRNVFNEHAIKINQFLKKHSIVGFRSPSMYHNLDWLHELNIEYDASTFDTDPFEPQPDGAETIFPFWVAGPDGRPGYVELPYNLPQDFLLFILMQHKNIDIWKNKIDWIAGNGGMALFISHPDYMNFNGCSHYEKYPVKYYVDFLKYVKTKYEGQYWYALPKDMARFWKMNYASSNKITERKNKIKVCMLAYSFYTNDARVRRYAETLASRGDHVDILALRNKNEKSYEILNGVHVYRIQERTRDEQRKFDYLFKIMKFVFTSSYHVTKKHIKSSYDLIHVHSVPDFEVFAAFLPKMTGAKIILDIHDPVPDFYQAKFGTDNRTYYTILSFVEKMSAKFAHHVITVTHYWMNKIAQRSNIPGDKISVTLNLPDIRMFNYAKIKKKPKKENENFTLIYPGTINKHCGLEIAIRAIDIARRDIPKIRFVIYGSGPELNQLAQLTKELKLEDIVHFRGSVPLEAIPDIMFNADIGIALLAGNDNYAQQALNVKLFEYLSMGLPAIATRTKSIEYYLDEDTVLLSEPNNPNDVARCIIDLYSHPEKRMDLKEKGLKFIAKNNSEIQMHDYIRIVDKLTA